MRRFADEGFESLVWGLSWGKVWDFGMLDVGGLAGIEFYDIKIGDSIPLKAD